MEPTQAKPVKKRRRRWLIVGLLLVLVSGVAWWNWPRGDGRFVGKWQFVRESGPVPAFMVFSSNGAGRTLDASGNAVSHFSWKVDGGVLIFQPPLGLRRSAGLSAIRHALQKHFGTSLLDYEQRAEVLTLTHDLLETRFAGSGSAFNLRRASDE